MKIYLVEGLSFLAPGRIQEAHATPESADAGAAALVNILLDEMEMAQDATAENWKDRMKAARRKSASEESEEMETATDETVIDEFLGDDAGDVWITEFDLQGLAMRDWRAVEGETEDDGKPIDGRPWGVMVDFAPEKIMIDLKHPDHEKSEGMEHSVWIEIADNCVVAHCYDPGHDEPFNVRIGAKAIVTDHDRRGSGDITHTIN